MRIALIGGGAAAVSLLDSLLAVADTVAGAPEIDIYEPSRLGHGAAFGPDLDCALTNLPNGDMTIRDGQRDHYICWLEKRLECEAHRDVSDLAAAYSPRWLFGTYLLDQLTRNRAEAERRGWTVRVRPELVCGLAEGIDRRLVVRSTGGPREYSHVVIGIGAGEPADPYQLAGSPRFIADPYPLNNMVAAIPPAESVVVVGTGLTAVDVALALLTHGHQGPITLLSRQGVLPQVRAARLSRELEHVTAERVGSLLAIRPVLRISEIWRMVEDELRSLGGDPEVEISWLRGPVNAQEHLRRQMSNPRAHLVQSVLMMVSAELGRTIRSAMAPDDLKELSRHKRLLKSLQCPMPAPTARTLLMSMDSGQLRVVAGINSVRSEGGWYRVSAAEPVPTARYVIDATRLTPGQTTGGSRPLISALSSRFATWDVHGGLRTDRSTAQVRRPDGTHDARLFAIGELTAGDVYFASSLPAINRSADAVAKSLAAQSRTGRRSPGPVLGEMERSSRPSLR